MNATGTCYRGTLILRPSIGAGLPTPYQPLTKYEAALFFRWYADVSKYVIVVVNIEDPSRRWLMTAHFVRTPAGELLWEKI